ncbi:50S ribosomal protein L9 [Candidatus Falkowbacteria bacterium RIFOXYA2_FULL_35_8]|uniref:Large ribosomal subunit protein bL9 n=1 Tax=Candidatus Falkowbacteria bacterium RIFOXYC2_FULL_36_12 TaxID=1798002 RepID=A0A1F5SXG7_9BACT|nr:MAG: 50S ribosomal protein L9 [Candidatus Falkowbacteria bacterium RIFOXYC2_FULL_36_12]OGF31211.1 MAG: 50S ribosomal protein L9 [Candidatus Falkowbacteria bacterium RIFOXYB2_FULL_35_7]OGF32993.1 MAG: 50S ribosomal protein L9 [Candidatus Falkowbacteria bacterium RIFOXYA2_FULL_35_8]
MKVVFIKVNSKSGKLGEVKEVADGFAINFLIPQMVALPATKKNIDLANSLVQKKQVGKKENFDWKKLANRLKGFILNLEQKSDEHGSLFAKINNRKIIEMLNQRGFEVKESQVKLDQPISKVGEYEVEINLEGFKSKIKIIVE